MSRAEWSPWLVVCCSACLVPVDVGEVPSNEPCIGEGARGDNAVYAAIVDGYSAPCPSWLRQNPNERAMLVFTGAAWSGQTAACRAADPWYQHTPQRNWGLTWPATQVDLHGDGVIHPTQSNGALAPPTALGYCAVNEGQASEFLLYSTCGIARLGPGLCEEVLVQAADDAITAEWHACPNPADPRCAKAPVEHDCLPPLDEIDGRLYARYMDTPYFTCTDGGDAWDSMIVSQAQGWDDPSFQCMSTQAWDRTTSKALQVKVDRAVYSGSTRTDCSAKILIDDEEGAPAAAMREPNGYCEVWPGTRYRYAIYNFCEAGELDPRARCSTAWSTSRGEPAVWHACPGSELCFSAKGQACSK